MAGFSSATFLVWANVPCGCFAGGVFCGGSSARYGVCVCDLITERPCRICGVFWNREASVNMAWVDKTLQAG